MVFGALQNRLLLGLFAECIAVRAIAGDFGVDLGALCEFLGSDEDGLYTKLITVTRECVENARQHHERVTVGSERAELGQLHRVLGSMHGCRSTTQAVLATVAQSATGAIEKIASHVDLAKVNCHLVHRYEEAWLQMLAKADESASVVDVLCADAGM